LLPPWRSPPSRSRSRRSSAFGIIPNFYVVYDHDAAPLTTKLKFKLAAKVAFDPVTFIAVGLIAAITRQETSPTTARVRRVTLSAMALAIPTALPTS
jgi:hypothetical protein